MYVCITDKVISMSIASVSGTADTGLVSSGGHFGPQAISQLVQEVKRVEVVFSCHTAGGGRRHKAETECYVCKTSIINHQKTSLEQ